MRAKGQPMDGAKLNVHAELFPEDDKILKVFKYKSNVDQEMKNLKALKRKKGRKGGREEN